MLRMKYLLTLGLAVLVVSIAAGAAFAQASWRLGDVDLPDYVAWDADIDGGIDIHNDGTVDLTEAGYELWSCEGTSVSVDLLIDRWGTDTVPLPEDGIAIGATESVELALVAPPITTPTSSSVQTLACDWALRDIAGSSYVTPPSCAEADISIGRFPDSIEWHRNDTERDAGRVPFIVQGFPDGLYRPNMKVPRDQMAVFIRRGMNISPTEPAEATFPDVPDDFWAYGDIEALADGDVVLGYPDGSYQPTYTVTRGQMAVFVARAKGWVTIDDPMETEEDVFSDVPSDYWCALAVEECVDGNVVQGYGDDTYRPTVWVDRAQMSVYTWRAFQSPSYPVVLGGPAITDVYLPTIGYHGWSSTAPTATASTYAYVEFDVANLDADTLAPAATTWDITFDFRDADTPTVTGVTQVVQVSNATIAGATGTYLTVYVAVPVGSLPAGDYVLVVLVEDSTNVAHELPRTVEFLTA